MIQVVVGSTDQSAASREPEQSLRMMESVEGCR